MRKVKNVIRLKQENIVDKFTYSALKECKDYVFIDGTYQRCLYISGYPLIASSGWIQNIINTKYDCDVSFFIEELDSNSALPKLQRKITELESTKRSMLKEGKILTSEINDPLSSAIELRDKIIRGQEKLFQLSLYIALRAVSLRQLEKLTTILEANLGSRMFTSKISYFQQLKNLESILPKLDNQLSIKRNINSSSLALCFPFVSSELVQQNGILYGVNKSNNSLVIIDRFGLQNANSIIFAQSGSGKSYLSKVEILRQLAEGTHVIVIDPEREYANLCKQVEGTYIKMSPSNNSQINPFDIATNIKKRDLFEHIQELTLIIEELVQGLNENEKSIIDRVLIEIYKNKDSHAGIRRLYSKLVEIGENNLAKRLEKYVTGSLSKLFSQKTVDLNNRLIIFDIKDLTDNLKKLMMLLISSFVYNKVKFEPTKRLLVIDEGWMLLENKSTAQFISGLVRRARKYYLGVSIITQQANDFLSNEYGRAIASQSAMRILMKQDTTSIKGVSEEFGLSNYEKNYLLTCEKGDALMLIDSNHVAVEILASDTEHPIITTDPKEIYK